jgi:hypothetical protein
VLDTDSEDISVGDKVLLTYQVSPGAGAELSARRRAAAERAVVM